ncbi:ferredoxin reductase family protein [Sphaerisporangium sp. TRM90804]|uniref:ferredoxin reductase family protein n=1 Tax=Sphaerisporangium sp. TRM90804 TaxID=3031113 RepID=UPI002449B25A|nr:ferredoxin reductase family protein [Sphaerisporangium sp. TRM90804]MDH2429672.1 ferredoxin reductase family protein [Sphaerisporangium sp. TRM90804]
MTVVVAIVAVNAGLWLVLPPAAAGPHAVRQVLGEFVASTAVLLFSVTLVLATRARFLEPYFGGLDRMYRAHRRTGQAGFLLLTAHVALIPWTLGSPGGTPSGFIAFAGIAILVLLTVGPRLALVRRVVTLNYRGWRHTHKFIGLFFTFGFAHMLLVDQVVETTAVPFAVLVAAYVAGIAAYLYTLLLARFVRPTFPYLVEVVRRLNSATIEVSLRPRKKKRLTFRSGQFVFVRFHRWGLREPHPFTVSSAPSAEHLRLTIKASGDYTRRVHRDIQAGHRVTVEGSYGMLDYRRGGPRQIWIAGGIGVTPFLSWLRDMEQTTEHTIDLFCTVRQADEALFWDEIRAAADRHPRLRVHTNVSSEAGSLTVPRIVATAGDLDGAHIYMCGPVSMINSFERGFRRLGVPATTIHFEEFSFR